MINYDGLFDKQLFLKEIEAKHEVIQELSYSKAKNALVLPCIDLPNGFSGGGIIKENGEFIKESTVHNGSHVPYEVNHNQVEIVDERVVYFGMLIGVWGHCISDCIKRAWFINSPEYIERFAKCKIIYTAQKDSLHKNFIDFLSLLGINIDTFYEITKPTIYSEVIIPDSSFFLDDNGVEHFTKEYREVIEKIKEPFKSVTGISKKIYYSHRNVRGIMNDMGERQIEKYLQNHGFEVVHPELLSVQEQLKLLAQCKVFISSDGSTSHNSIFLPEESEIIIIPRSPYLTFHQLALNELFEKQKIYYIDSTISIMCKGNRPTRGPFYYFVSPNLIEHIENKPFYESKKWLVDNFKEFKKYLQKGFYIENDRKYTAISPYTEIAFYYYNKYLFTSNRKVKTVFFTRKICEIMYRIIRRLLRIVNYD